MRALGPDCLIEKLNFTNCNITSRGGTFAMKGSMKYKRLKELILDKNVIDGTKFKAIKEMLCSSSQVQTLSMNSCQLGPEGALQIA